MIRVRWGNKYGTISDDAVDAGSVEVTVWLDNEFRDGMEDDGIRQVDLDELEFLE